MFNRIFSFLRSSFQFMSSPTSQTSANEEFQGTSDFLPLASSHHLEVQDYLRLIIANAFSAERQEQLNHHTVVKLEHMKDDGQAQHEHVIATVKDDNDNVVCISIGRSKGQNDAQKASSLKKRPNKSYSRSSSTLALASIPNSSQDSIFKPVPAIDVVQNIENKTPPPSRVQSIFKPQSPMPLLHLAIIIATVHDQNSLYTVLRGQCYWFAMLVMGVSMAQGGWVTSYIDKSPKSKVKANPEPEMKFLNRLALSDPNVDSSEWTQIPILPPPPEELYETVRDLGPSVGKHNNIPVVAVGIDEIHDVALESQRRYQAQLAEFAKKRSGFDKQIREAEAAKQEAQKLREENAALKKLLAAQQGPSAQ